ncbi:hypothetical protein C8R43DRAFT_1130958 [Mycena crocata]|nr:hypothetical protein C8R43DRAFT_1130958 [Mycena crocata]
MQDSPPQLSRLRAHEINTALKAHKDIRSVWWHRRPPLSSSFDRNGYPMASVFGQVVGEGKGASPSDTDLPRVEQIRQYGWHHF